MEEEEEVEKELINEKYPEVVTIEGTKKILEQMEKCICKIFTKDGNKGTGFFCKINDENKDIPVMMTNYHVINDKYIKENDKIKITINDDKEDKTIQLRNKIIYTNEEYDITIIEIKEKDEINNYMNLDARYINTIDIIYDKSIYIIQYPLGKKAGVSYGIINNLNEYNIEYHCNTQSGSSGSPIINIANNEIIGIHKQGLKKRTINRGTLLKYPIKDFINKKLTKNINEIENDFSLLEKDNLEKEIKELLDKKRITEESKKLIDKNKKLATDFLSKAYIFKIGSTGRPLIEIYETYTNFYKNIFETNFGFDKLNSKEFYNEII